MRIGLQSIRGFRQPDQFQQLNDPFAGLTYCHTSVQVQRLTDLFFNRVQGI